MRSTGERLTRAREAIERSRAGNYVKQLEDTGKELETAAGELTAFRDWLLTSEVGTEERERLRGMLGDWQRELGVAAALNREGENWSRAWAEALWRGAGQTGGPGTGIEVEG